MTKKAIDTPDPNTPPGASPPAGAKADKDRLADADLAEVSGGLGGRASPDFTWQVWSRKEPT